MKPRPSLYNGAIPKKFAVFLKSVQVLNFAINWDAARKKKVFAVWEALLNPGGSYGVREMGCEFGGRGCDYS